eukprot:gnl/MRDRNA2_/MRDRNA2_68599_c0_seq1.p1 gnl/MRDRNA2_/MRDRNA2_68599_c0~~gnl/MRDRNA2_/MRDRNA2_68599_c0_seq1.p1  ORF type:complete len:534 (-),score=73.72 gnl/MRDRNA2_/MRDRNA2_68599_c0_seq1:99-1517(-)
MAPMLWSDHKMIDHFGNVTLQTTESRTHTRIAQYLKASRADLGFEQLFADSDGAAPLVDAVYSLVKNNTPSALSAVDARRIVSVGRARTGSLMHRHSVSWLYLSVGIKDWFLLAPDTPEELVRPMFKSDPCKLHIKFPQMPWVICRQHAGEAGYLPSGTWHATCNADGDPNANLTVGAGAQGQAIEADALLYAARDGDLTKIRQICLAGPLVSKGQVESAVSRKPDKIYRNALHIAASHDRISAVELLVSADCGGAWMARAPAVPSGVLPVHEAIRCGSLRVLQLLLSREPSLASTSTKSGALTPLYLAAHFGQAEAAGILLDFRADINSRSINSSTALHVAVKRSKLSVLQILLSNGADPALQDNFGNLPVHFAMEHGHQLVLEALLASARGSDQLSWLAKTPKRRRASWQRSHLNVLANNHTFLGSLGLSVSGPEGLPRGLLNPDERSWLDKLMDYLPDWLGRVRHRMEL